MKEVLIIDETPLFRDYLKEKLSAEHVKVETAMNKRDGFTKLLSMQPDLLVLDASWPYEEILEFLMQKKRNPNSALVPVILSGPVLSHEQLAKFGLLNVVKYFNKPIKIDTFLETVGKQLGLTISIDSTPCILETHLNENLIFIEISGGLNREKITLLRYRLRELIQINKITIPKIVLMTSNLSLSFVDGINLEMLLGSILADNRVRDKNVKVLTKDPFLKEFIAGHREYQGFVVSENMAEILPTVLPPTTHSGGDPINQTIEFALSSTSDINQGSVQVRFHSDNGSKGEDKDAIDSTLSIAIVDDDPIVRTLLEKSFSVINAKIEKFEDAIAFLGGIERTKFNVVILDISLPGGKSGFDILNLLRAKQYNTIVVVYSGLSQREAVVKALSLGANAYLIKPLKPELVVQKVIELLKNQAE